MGDSVVYADKWEETHVPQEVLLCDYFIESNKDPSLQQHAEEQIVVEPKSSCDYANPLRNKAQNSQG